MPLTSPPRAPPREPAGPRAARSRAARRRPSAPGAPHASAYDYFAAPAPGDAWSPKIAGWQERERGALPVDAAGSPASVSGSGAGPASLDARRTGPARRVRLVPRRAAARRSRARWRAGSRSRRASTTCPTAPIDHWATLRETLARGGEDCDGLELLVNRFLRELGFARGRGLPRDRLPPRRRAAPHGDPLVRGRPTIPG